MMPHFVLALVAAAQLTVAFPTHGSALGSSKVGRAPSFCEYPEEFVIKNFQTWTPDAGNNRSATVDFEYSDDITNFNTKCHFNGTSVNLAKQGSPARYACDLKWVHFTWQTNGTLRVMEKLCPYEDMETKFKESVGSVTPKLDCYASAPSSSNGAGKACRSVPKVLSAEFTGREPMPE